MGKRLIPQMLFGASAVLFGVCAALQFTVGNVDLGLVFGVIAAVGIAMFILLRTGRISW